MLERIRREGGVSIAELADRHAVSTITVHRDLAELSADGLIERVHGGARAINGQASGERIETAWDGRVAQSREAKAAIAARAARLVNDNATIFLDSSSTCLALARALEADPPQMVTLVTNSPAIAFELSAESIHVIVTPGEVDQHMRLIGGRWAYEFLSELNIDVAFISAAGITLEQGLTTSRRPWFQASSNTRRIELTEYLLELTKVLDQPVNLGRRLGVCRQVGEQPPDGRQAFRGREPLLGRQLDLRWPLVLLSE